MLKIKFKKAPMNKPKLGSEYSSIFFIIIFFFSAAISQTSELTNFNTYRNEVNQTAMLALGGWAIGNITVGSVLYFKTSGSNKYFHQMNIAWNLVNLGIAGIGYYSSINPDTTITLINSLKEQSSIEKILLFNAGLDIAYIMTGFYLKERSKNSENNSNRFKGYGNSLILQGAFLFLFDLTLYYFQIQNNLPLESLSSSLLISPGFISLQFTF
jgi:hypothetical protein